MKQKSGKKFRALDLEKQWTGLYDKIDATFLAENFESLRKFCPKNDVIAQQKLVAIPDCIKGYRFYSYKKKRLKNMPMNKWTFLKVKLKEEYQVPEVIGIFCLKETK